VGSDFFRQADSPRGGYDWSQPNETATRQIAREVSSNHQVLVVDIEHFPGDIRTASAKSVQETIQKLGQLVDWVHAERPDVKVGFYGLLPLRDYWTPVNYWMTKARADADAHDAWAVQNLPRYAEKYRAWQAANDFLKPLADKVDYLFPSLYTFYDDQAGWCLYAKGNLTEAQRYGKPIVPFLWMEYHDSTPRIGQYLSGEYWRTELDTVRQYASGVVIWGGVKFSPNAPAYNEPWNETAPWWVATKDFLASV
jgi:hypothetical protein